VKTSGSAGTSSSSSKRRKARQQREEQRAAKEAEETRKRSRAALHEVPEVRHDLREEAFQGVTVDACTFCEGVFFDAGELDKVLLEKDTERSGFLRSCSGSDAGRLSTHALLVDATTCSAHGAVPGRGRPEG